MSAVLLALLLALGVALVFVLGSMFHGSGRFTDDDGALANQVTTHREELRALAEAFDRGQVADGAKLPRSLHTMATDDVAHVWSVDRGDPRERPVLFIQTWQDWRAENGVGLAYLGSQPDAAMWVRTAEGDGGHPERDMGDGWWWVE